MTSRLALSCLICVFIVCASASSHAQANWEQSAKLCSDYSGEKALSSCEQAVREMPDTAPDEYKARVFLYMGIALGEQDRNEEALYYLERASKLDPDNAKIWYNLGVTHAAMGHHTKALYAYRKATSLNESFLLAWGNRGVEAYNTKRYYEATTSFECAMKVDPAYFDTRPEQRKMYDKSSTVEPKSVQMRREINVRLSPYVAYMYPVGNDFNVDEFIYLMLDGEVDVQLYGGWFATGSFMYAHTKWKSASQGGGVDIYAPTFGIKYQRTAQELSPPESLIFFDKSRYWFSVAVGPYITNASAAAVPAGGPFSLGRNSVDIGANVGAGFDYFFYPNVGVGFNVKMHYANFDENYFIFAGGPHIIGRF